MYRNSKQERKQWWKSLSDKEKSKYLHKWEHKRDSPKKKKLNLPPLTEAEKLAINKRMTEIGMEKYIVL